MVFYNKQWVIESSCKQSYYSHDNCQYSEQQRRVLPILKEEEQNDIYGKEGKIS